MKDPELPDISGFPESGDPIRDGIQRHINAIEDGPSQLVHYVVLAGVSVMTDNGWKTVPKLYVDSEQADYVTEGLLGRADELMSYQSFVVENDDEDEDTESDP